MRVPCNVDQTMIASARAEGPNENGGSVLKAPLQHEAVLNVDETGHWTNGDKRWLWTFVACAFVVYRIAPSRGSDVLITVLGQTFTGILAGSALSAASIASTSSGSASRLRDQVHHRPTSRIARAVSLMAPVPPSAVITGVMARRSNNSGSLPRRTSA